jgi:hypothetical protein
LVDDIQGALDICLTIKKVWGEADESVSMRHEHILRIQSLCDLFIVSLETRSQDR